VELCGTHLDDVESDRHEVLSEVTIAADTETLRRLARFLQQVADRSTSGETTSTTTISNWSLNERSVSIAGAAKSPSSILVTPTAMTWATGTSRPCRYLCGRPGLATAWR